MAKPLSQDVVLERFRKVHGDKYGYDQVSYKNMNTKVKIVCPLHGEFLQTPASHLRGSGCPECGKTKQKETMLERYGAKNPMQVKEFYDKARKTCVEKYGSEWALSNSDIQEKQKRTVQDRYGVDHISQSEEVQRKIKDSIVNSYGTVHVMQNEDVKAKAQETCLKKYGSKSPLGSPMVREKIKKTNLERYGGYAPMSSSEVQKKSQRTCREKYGTDHPSQNRDVLDKILNSKIENGTIGKSKSEDLAYEMLCLYFGSGDIVRHYTSEEYPFACDFYIPSRNLYIEMNLLWTHHFEWYDEENSDHVQEAELWKKGSPYYQSGYYTWTDLDVRKRQAASQHNLNYVVFWDEHLRDFDLWLLSGAPDSQDWIDLYQWLPERNFDESIEIPQLTGTFSNLSQVIKAYQREAFYKKEISLWCENPLYKKMRLQMWLYVNRYKYLGKLPHELTDLEILRGFTISGIHKGFTVFNVELMDRVVRKYDISSIYDPCAGWGERLLYAHTRNLFYTGMDINSDLKSNYDLIIKDFNIKDQRILFGDSSKEKPLGNYQAVITCPPYGSTEIYSEFGSENLNTGDFLFWWEDVVKNCLDSGIQYFCFQVNQKWKESMSTVLLEKGLVFVEELTYEKGSKSSHFTRRKDKNLKNEYESMLVFRSS